jgi:hypothetical protein
MIGIPGGSSPKQIGQARQSAIHSGAVFRIGVLDFPGKQREFHGLHHHRYRFSRALSLKRDSAAAAIKKAIELLGDGCRDVCITDPEGRIHSHADFDQLFAADKT